MAEDDLDFKVALLDKLDNLELSTRRIAVALERLAETLQPAVQPSDPFGVTHAHLRILDIGRNQ